MKWMMSNESFAHDVEEVSTSRIVGLDYSGAYLDQDFCDLTPYHMPCESTLASPPSFVDSSP